jgi:peroxiredoxin Q/BCP
MRYLLWSVLMFCLTTACATTQRADGGEGLLAAGEKAPNLSAVDHNGQAVRVPNDAPTLVFFYPRDGTPGCTREACAFRDAWQKYVNAGVRVIGVSVDSADSHRKFAKEHGLTFPLVTDEKDTWSKAFGVGKMMGMHKRVSFLIAPDGTIKKTYGDVDPGVHATQVLADVNELGLISAVQ